MTEYNRVYNFSAGPSVLPLPVLEKVKEDLLNYQGSGQSVMEMSHRSTYFKKIIEDAEADLRAVSYTHLVMEPLTRWLPACWKQARKPL